MYLTLYGPWWLGVPTPPDTARILIQREWVVAAWLDSSTRVDQRLWLSRCESMSQEVNATHSVLAEESESIDLVRVGELPDGCLIILGRTRRVVGVGEVLYPIPALVAVLARQVVDLARSTTGPADIHSPYFAPTFPIGKDWSAYVE